MNKPILYFDMDNVLADFKSGLAKVSEETKAMYKENPDEIPGIFSLMEPMPGAVEAVNRLKEKYDCYILSTAPWKTPSAWSDKLEWVKRYFDKDGEGVFHKRLILTHNKNLCLQPGAWLIDDRGKHGAEEFGSHWICFGSEKFPNWDAVTKFLMPSRLRCMGAFCGDIAGSAYEFNPVKRKDINLFCASSAPTDDSIMTMANMRWLAEGSQSNLVEHMHEIGGRYFDVGYGGHFYKWLKYRDTEPYNSYGNGSAMRVSPVAWVGRTLEEVLDLAKRSAEVTHNHPEGIKGAQATAAAIFLARQGKSKEEIKRYVEGTFDYDLSRTVDEIRPWYGFDETCPGSVSESIICFLEAEDFEDTLRNAISLGGDADTMAAIAGAIAEAYYGIPDEILDEAWNRLDSFQQQIVIDFQSHIVE